MEITALDSALVFLQEAAADPTPREVRICLDSHSALGRLREGPAAQRDVVVDRQMWWTGSGSGCASSLIGEPT